MIYIGADHRGFELKGQIINWLKSNGYEVQDCGALEYNKEDDFVDFAVEVSKRVSSDEKSKGFLICGSGAGVDIVANKIKGIRASLGLNSDQVKHAREADDLNILAIASDYTKIDAANEMVKTFLETDYEPLERRQRRIEKIKNLE